MQAKTGGTLKALTACTSSLLADLHVTFVLRPYCVGLDKREPQLKLLFTACRQRVLTRLVRAQSKRALGV